jgi:hypothetical protein
MNVVFGTDLCYSGEGASDALSWYDDELMDFMTKLHAILSIVPRTSLALAHCLYRELWSCVAMPAFRSLMLARIFNNDSCGTGNAFRVGSKLR